VALRLEAGSKAQTRDSQVSFSQRLRKVLAEHLLAWILFALLAVAVYANYERGRELDRVCELIGPHDLSVTVARTAREEINNICIKGDVADD
jgi:hypothetical protein